MNIDYAPFALPGLAPDETGYQVNGGQCAAVRLTRANGAAVHMFGFTAVAFAMESDGTPTLTADIKTIEAAHTVSCRKVDLLEDGQLSQAKVDDMKDRAINNALAEMMGLLAVEAALGSLSI